MKKELSKKDKLMDDYKNLNVMRNSLLDEVGGLSESNFQSYIKIMDKMYKIVEQVKEIEGFKE